MSGSQNGGTEQPNEPAPDERSEPRLWRAIAVSGVGVVIGVISLGLFCYALGVNLRDEGWSDDRAVDRRLLTFSLAGFGVATLMFWAGFISISHSKH